MDESININPFMASGACGTMIDDFSGDNFDHKDWDLSVGANVGTIRLWPAAMSFIRLLRVLRGGAWSGKSSGLATTITQL